MECGDQPRQPHSIIHRRKALLKRTLNRSVQKGFLTTVESQLVVLGQAVTRGSTPKATLFELALFRRFFTISLLTESYGESVAFGALENEEDSNRDRRCQSLKPNHHGPHDSHHLAD